MLQSLLEQQIAAEPPLTKSKLRSEAAAKLQLILLPLKIKALSWHFLIFLEWSHNSGTWNSHFTSFYRLRLRTRSWGSRDRTGKDSKPAPVLQPSSKNDQNWSCKSTKLESEQNQLNYEKKDDFVTFLRTKMSPPSFVTKWPSMRTSKRTSGPAWIVHWKLTFVPQKTKTKSTTFVCTCLYVLCIIIITHSTMSRSAGCWVSRPGPAGHRCRRPAPNRDLLHSHGHSEPIPLEVDLKRKKRMGKFRMWWRKCFRCLMLIYVHDCENCVTWRSYLILMSHKPVEW